MPFTLDEIDRYERQVLLPEWGAAGQERVRAASVMVIGTGPAAEMVVRYLAGAGVGTIGSELPLDLARSINPHVVVETRLHSESQVASAPIVVLHASGGLVSRIVGNEDREAVGAAVAVEALKEILGLPHRKHVSLPRMRTDEDLNRS